MSKSLHISYGLQIIQLYEMIIVRHGLMLVGAPFSGKSVGLNLLAGALSDLHAEGKQGTLFEKVEMRVINPKSVTMGQLYGEVDKATQEWKVSSQQHAGCSLMRHGFFHHTRQCAPSTPTPPPPSPLPTVAELSCHHAQMPYMVEHVIHSARCFTVC